MNEDLTQYDIKPEAFINYLRYYGEHFNKKLCEFACKQFAKVEYNKEKLDILLQSHNITLDNSKLYDAVYIANWCRNVFYGSSIQDEKHFVLFIKDIFDKESKLVFNRWYADASKQGIPIEWEDMI